MVKKKKIVHDEIIQMWHIDPFYQKPGSREFKLIRALCLEESFNDLLVKSHITDEPDMVSNMV